MNEIEEMFNTLSAAKSFTVDGDKGKVKELNGQQALFSTDALGVPGYIPIGAIESIEKEKATYKVRWLFDEFYKVYLTSNVKFKK